MLSNSGDPAPNAASAEPTERRRRVFRTAAIAVGLGWTAVIALIVVGLTIAPSAPQTAAAPVPAPTHSSSASPSSHPTATATATASPTTPATPAVHRAAQVPPSPPKLSGPQLTETSREFAHVPGACAPVHKCENLGCKHSEVTPVTTAFSSVQAAFNGRGDALPEDASAGNFDCGGFSYQAQQLSSNGFGPGDEVAVEGEMLKLPGVTAGAPDEIAARGQVIQLNLTKPASKLAFLGAGEFAAWQRQGPGA